jgi:hypothetical protein
VVTFAIIERVAPPFKITSKEKEWEPAELLKKPDIAKIPLATPIVGIIFTLVALVVFNVFQGIPVVKNLQDGEWMTLITLSDSFYRVLPLINILWVLTIGFHCFTLVQRRWTPVLRLVNIGLQVYGIVIVAILLAGADMINVNLETLAELNTAGVPSVNLGGILNIIVRASLGIAIVVAVVQIGTTVYKWMRNIIKR